jgi:tetrahydromethanopterin S-methyltransferase subunit D
MSANQESELGGHWQILGICWIVYGVLRLIMGIVLILFSGTATVMFGALLVRVPNPFALMADFHIVYTALVVLAILCGLLGLLAGLALMSNQSSARMLSIVAAFLSISDIPLGLTLGIYTLVVMFPLHNFSSRARVPASELQN